MSWFQNRFVFVVLIAAMAFTGIGAAQDIACSWQVGVARVDITPQSPLWAAGYASRNRAVTETLHPLFAKALAVQDAAGNKAILITADILGFPKPMADRVVNRIGEAHGLKRAQMLLAPSHTHSGPVIDQSLKCIYPYAAEDGAAIDAYAAWLEAQLAGLADAAMADMKPAALYAGNGAARFAVNRRNNVERELTPTTPLLGPQDHAVPTLKAVRADGTVAAVLFGYACHATVLDGYAWCGDYPGFAQLALEEMYPGCTALFFAGCGADQNPLPRRSVGLARQYGRTLAEAVRQALEEAARPLEARLDMAYAEIPLALEPAPDQETLRARIAALGGYEQACTQALLDRLAGGETLPDAYPYPIQTWRLGEQLLVALGGEITVAYALGIKARLGQDVFVMGYANDVMGYIPSEQILQEGGYEGRTSQLIYGLPNTWRGGIESAILDATTLLVNELPDGKQQPQPSE